MNKLLYLRPNELSCFITRIKILKKYDRLSEREVYKYDKIFSQLFQETPYPFCWKLFYDKKENNIKQEEKDMYTSFEKKVLFNYTYFPVDPNPPLPLSEDDNSSSSTAMK
jgi:hypothetical protein